MRRKADKMGSLNDYARYGEIDKIDLKLVTFPADEIIALLSIDEVCVVKVDVEGAELDVLQGLVGSIGKYKPFLYCEIWQLPEKEHPTFDDKYKKSVSVFELMTKLDYKILGVSIRDNNKIEILNSVDMLGDKYRRDYIMAPDSDVDLLIRSLMNSK